MAKPRIKRTAIVNALQQKRARGGVIIGAVALVPTSTRTMASIAFVRRSAPLSPRRIVVAAFENRTGDSTLAGIGATAGGGGVTLEHPL